MAQNKGNPVRTILLKEPRAISLINQRAVKENRSAANAATTTIIEALTGQYGKAGTGGNQEKK